MPKKKSGKKPQRKRMTFKLVAPEAREVILLGDFNDWDKKKHFMKRDQNGIWSKIVMLAPGRYEYKFLLDGDWHNDPSNDQTVPNTFGTLNSVLIV
jgi:1,4-alpha-glucan branching enzyme